MLKDDGNIVMGSSIYGSRMLDWWFPRCLFECLSFMASRELFAVLKKICSYRTRSKERETVARHGGGRQLSNFESPVVGGEFYETFRHSRALCCVDECSFVRGRNDLRKPPAVLYDSDDDDDKEEEEERHAEFSENQKTRLNRLKIYIERREQCKAPSSLPR